MQFRSLANAAHSNQIPHLHRCVRSLATCTEQKYIPASSHCLLTFQSSHPLPQNSLSITASMENIDTKLAAFAALKTKAMKTAFLKKINEDILEFKNQIRVTGSIDVITANYRAYLERVAATASNNNTVLPSFKRKKVLLT